MAVTDPHLSFSMTARGPREFQMETVLVKIFATALALSDVMIEPQAVKTHFDPMNDRERVVQILRAGCIHVRGAFDIASLLTSTT